MDNIPSTEEAKQEQFHLKSALGSCVYKPWTFVNALKPI